MKPKIITTLQAYSWQQLVEDVIAGLIVAMVALPLSIAGLLGLESTLSFLGVGLPPEIASWGQQLAAARQAPQAWWAILFPALMLATTILSMHFLAPRNQQQYAKPNR